MRLFAGIPITDEVAGNLSRLIDHLRSSARIRWTPVYNLHITTKFIGEWPEERLGELQSALAPLGQRAPIPISVEGIGWLPNPHTPRVLFTGIRAGSDLAQLAAETDAAAASLGIEPEKREFRPHLTLARVRDSSASLAPLRRAIASLESVSFGSWTAPGFSLYLSKPGPSGSIYTQLAEIPFTA